MKNQSVIVRVLPVFFDILRVLTIICGTCALLVATAKFFKSDYIQLTSPIKIERQVITTGISAKNANIEDIKVTTTVPLLKASLKVDFFVIVATYLYIISTCLVMIVQFQNLRDFFKSIKIGEPFDPKNVYRLRMIGSVFLGFFVIGVIKQAVINIWLEHTINNLNFSDLYWTAGFYGLIWAVIIFIIADVFKYGFTLKKENEEFV